MEDVLEVYQRPHDPDRPVVCLDETTKQLVKETRVPVPAKPGQPARYDCEYERNGTVNLFMLFAPLEGWRHVEITDRHAALDYAQLLKALSDTHFRAASKIVLVQDNLKHPQAGLALRSLSARRGAPPRRAVRVALHAQAWQLAGYGRIRTQRPVGAVPRSANPGQADPDRGSRRVAERSKQEPHEGRLALHHCRCPHQTEAVIPGNMSNSGH